LFKTIAVFLSLCALPLAAQSNSGELRLKIIDPSGIPVRTPVHIVSEANDYQKTLTASAAVTLDLQRLPYGIYRIEDVRGMVRNNANDFNSNPHSTPVEVFQQNWFREGYFNSSLTVDHGRHQLKLTRRIFCVCPLSHRRGTTMKPGSPKRSLDGSFLEVGHRFEQHHHPKKRAA